MTCQGASCLPPPVCGDGVCGAGETSTTCCADCGCPTGAWCSTATHTCLITSAAMHWTFEHQCASAGTISFRLFDDTNGGGWPAGSDVFLLPSGTSKEADIACIPGALICFGAAAGTLYWGGGLDDAEPCTNCCATCGGAVTVQPQALTCM